MFNIKIQYLSILVAISLFFTHAQAYTYTSSTQNDNKVSFGIGACNGSTSMTALSSDMYDLGGGNELIAEAYTGASVDVNWCTLSNNTVLPVTTAGLIVGESDGTNAAFGSFPWAFQALPSNATNLDVVLGNYISGGSKIYMAAIIYEAAGNIYLSVYQVNGIGTSTITLSPTSGGPVQLNSSPASYPHIDLFADNSTYKSGTVPNLHEFAAVWNESGIIKGFYGDLPSFSVSTTISPVTIGTGAVLNPDVAATAEYPTTTGAKTAYVTWTTGTDLYVTEWNPIAGTTGSTTTLESSSTCSAIYYPRIESQLFAGSGTVGQSIWCTAAAVDYGSGYTDAVAYSFNSSGWAPLTGTVVTNDITSLFGSTTENYLMPVVAGNGMSANSPGGTQFTIYYYSTIYNINNGYYGDFYASYVDMTGALSSSIYLVPLWGTAMSSSYFSLANLPCLSISTCSNTGHDLHACWFNSRWLADKNSGAGYAFKATSIEKPNVDNFNIYPNPATTNLVINKANDADYLITSMTGQLIKQGRLKTDHEPVNLSGVASGTYFIHLQRGDISETYKFVKN